MSYNFFIDNLGFHKNITKDRPYERATAPFRKDQLDTAPTVGDQSLVGWWTRGQLSFHKGAGVTYYEVLDGETVLNRFHDSDSVDVWTPGQASLIPNLADMAVTARSATPGTLSGVSGLFYTDGSTGMKFFDGASTTAITTSNSGVPTDVTSDGRYYLAVNGNRIERQATTGALRTNHVANPSFEVDTAGWNGLNAVVARDTTQSRVGGASLKVTCSAGVVPQAQYALTGLTPGTTYKTACRIFVPSSSSAEPNITGSSEPAVTTKGDWVLRTGTFTASAATATLAVTWITPSGTGEWYVDSVMVTEFPFDGDYFDGSTPGGQWIGTADASKSTYASNTPTASYALWRHGDAGYEFQRAWWAKGRIWAVDNTGRWYTLSPVGGTVTSTDAIWASRKTAAEWSLADSPGSVFIADSGTIYSLSVDVDGLAVNLQAPVVAGLLPAGETISEMFYYLGHLVLATSKGVRVAQVQDSQLIYGSLVIEGDFSAARGIGAAGSLVYLVGKPDDHDASTLCVLDLTQEIGPLRPPWAPWVQVNDTPASAAGALVDPSGRLFAWAGNLYGSGSTKAASGSITTGFHRFGTLDPKRFQQITVRAKGTGTIDVYRVDADDTEALLGSMNAADGIADFTVGLTEAVERVAFKFVLKRDATDATAGPSFLGYQVKALPSPERQRFIRVPLMLLDKETGADKMPTGAEGTAWPRLAALEALEESSSIVTFEDKDTGETGEAFVERVEMAQTAPSSNADRSNGFGGVIYVTLRKL